MTGNQDVGSKRSVSWFMNYIREQKGDSKADWLWNRIGEKHRKKGSGRACKNSDLYGHNNGTVLLWLTLGAQYTTRRPTKG